MLAEDLAQEALVAALEQWPDSGVPDNPGAWLMATAKHRAIDRLRREERLERKHEELGRELEVQQETAEADLDAAIDDDIGDDLLRLVFTTCHPVPSASSGPSEPSPSRAPVRGPWRGRAVRPPVVRARGRLPHLQGGLFGYRR